MIFLARSLAHPPLLIAEAGQNYLTAISTPFNFILFYEVLNPHFGAARIDDTFDRQSVRDRVADLHSRCFSDIAKAGDLVTEHRLTMETLPMFMDMWAGFLMFFIVAVFQHVALKRTEASSTGVLSRGKQRFIAQKKVVAAGLTVLLLVMAAYNIVLFAMAIWQTLTTGQGAIESATTFYNDLFTVMIFTDVLVLILSLVVSGKYELVFRNARVHCVDHPDSLFVDGGISLRSAAGAGGDGVRDSNSAGL